LAGHTVGEVQENGFDFLLPLWDIISNYDPKVEIIKAYFNAHTSGVEPSINLDDDDMTFIYYSNMTWNMNYGGETTIYDDDLNKGTIIPYKGNRLIGFTASKQHQAMPVSKKCFMLRTCVVFKTKFIKE
jgi:Rps23 Pro-64 3,4-dihydroxylase Tpa1-like proline 4-hydroxylase